MWLCLSDLSVIRLCEAAAVEDKTALCDEICYETYQGVCVGLLDIGFRIETELFAKVPHDSWGLVQDEVALLDDGRRKDWKSFPLACTIQHLESLSGAALLSTNFDVRYFSELEHETNELPATNHVILAILLDGVPVVKLPYRFSVGDHYFS